MVSCLLPIVPIVPIIPYYFIIYMRAYAFFTARNSIYLLLVKNSGLIEPVYHSPLA
jgi:hypothetical protein